MADIEKGYFPDKATQMEIKRGVDDVKAKQEQLKQSVNNISTQINNKSVGKVLRSRTYIANATFTVPTGVTEVYVTGGGGFGSNDTAQKHGATGGVTAFGNLLALSGGGGGKGGNASISTGIGGTSNIGW
ncbi:hypothetical protein [Lysinibacillus parviboronicapiens]|uniref:hypothetical protein n=1 Tax=Lysinibacillus parviboronicapiens TaxID=436516 RepID=UPI000D340524|nr:hypothetical protein [Lysinibacillus parviboronicapiens]